MTDVSHETPPPAGDNLPATSADPLTLRAILEARTTDISRRAGELVSAAERATVASDEDDEKATLLIAQINACGKAATGVLEDVGRPLYDGHKIVIAFMKTIVDPLATAKKKAERRQTEYRVAKRKAQEEAERRAREEAERRQREADEAARKAQEASQAGDDGQAQQDAMEASRRAQDASEAAERASSATKAAGTVRTDYGQTSSLRARKVVKAIDYEVLLKSDIGPQILANQRVREAIDKVIAGLVRGGMESLPGVEIGEEYSSVTR